MILDRGQERLERAEVKLSCLTAVQMEACDSGAVAGRSSISVKLERRALSMTPNWLLVRCLIDLVCLFQLFLAFLASKEVSETFVTCSTMRFLLTAAYPLGLLQGCCHTKESMPWKCRDMLLP